MWVYKLEYCIQIIFFICIQLIAEQLYLFQSGWKLVGIINCFWSYLMCMMKSEINKRIRGARQVKSSLKNVVSWFCFLLQNYKLPGSLGSQALQDMSIRVYVPAGEHFFIFRLDLKIIYCQFQWRLGIFKETTVHTDIAFI